MKIANVTIHGITPLLMNRFTEAAEQAVSNVNRTVFRGDKGTPRDQASPKRYCNAQNELLIPGPNLFRSIIEAGRFIKNGKSKLTTMATSLVPSFSSLDELECYLHDREGKRTTHFEVDSRAVVIPATGGRIMAHRPRVDDWFVSFSLTFDESEVDEKLMRQLVDYAGSKIGVGDFRPSRKGPFGKFKVTNWALKTN